MKRVVKTILNSISPHLKLPVFQAGLRPRAAASAKSTLEFTCSRKYGHIVDTHTRLNLASCPSWCVVSSWQPGAAAINKCKLQLVLHVVEFSDNFQNRELNYTVGTLSDCYNNFYSPIRQRSSVISSLFNIQPLPFGVVSCFPAVLQTSPHSEWQVKRQAAANKARV